MRTFQMAMELRIFLTDRGIDLSGEREKKTKTALEFFRNIFRRWASNHTTNCSHLGICQPIVSI
jgi:hypothetical protein